MKSSYNIAVIGDTSSGKTMLLFGLILTSKKGLHIASDDHQEEIDEMRGHLQKGEMPDGTLDKCVYNLRLRRRGIETPLAFKDYKGGDIENGKSFFDGKICEKDFSPDGVLFLMNPGQAVLNLKTNEDADDARLSKLTNLVDGIAGGWNDCKCHAIAAAVTAADRISKGGDLYEFRSKFFDVFNRYIVNPLKNSAKGKEIVYRTGFKISVTGRVENQNKLKIIPNNNAADPFLWLIDRIDRRKHPIRYWARRLWPLLAAAFLAGAGCWEKKRENSFVENICGKGEYCFKMAEKEFGSSAETNCVNRVNVLKKCIKDIKEKRFMFPEVKRKKDIVYTNLVSKYLLLEADAAFLEKKKYVNTDAVKPENHSAYALRKKYVTIDDPAEFNHYNVEGFSNEVAIARIRLDWYRTNQVLEVISEYNEKYFDYKIAYLNTNAQNMASETYISNLTNELADWEWDCSSIATCKERVDGVKKRFGENQCKTWRAIYASNIVSKVSNFGCDLNRRIADIFRFERKKLGSELRELLTTEEPATSKELYEAKKELLGDCRRSYFAQTQFSKNAKEYPRDDELFGNLMRLLQGTALTNCVDAWSNELHNRQSDWLWEEVGRVKACVGDATDYSGFLKMPYEGTALRVRSLLECVASWTMEEPRFDEECELIWDKFMARYFADKKWTLSDAFDYPEGEKDLDDKIKRFLSGTRIQNVENKVKEWKTKTREKQKDWLVDAMAECREFKGKFNAFDSRNGSGSDICYVIDASLSFVNEHLSGDVDDNKRVDAVRASVQKLVKTMKDKYFENEKFCSSYEGFSFATPKKDWKTCYEDAEKEISKGLLDIFKDDKAKAEFDFAAVTNEWKQELEKHELDWLLESHSQCSNAVNKFDGEAQTSVGFVTQHSGNPFLWQYVKGVKDDSEDFGLEKFKNDLESYANGGAGVDLEEVKERFVALHKNARDLSINAKGNCGKYAGLYDIFALRHLCTNDTPTKATTSYNNPSEKALWERIRDSAEQLSQNLSDKNWLSSKYRITTIKLMLSHPRGVAKYTTEWRNVMDIFSMTVTNGIADAQVVLLDLPQTFVIGGDYQAPREWVVPLSIDMTLDLNLFANMEFNGLYGEEYIRKGRDPTPIKDSPWDVKIAVPHLKTARGVSACASVVYESFANMGRGDPAQFAELKVSVGGEFVGPTPYDRIDACMQKAKEMEGDESNEWLKRSQAAEKRLNELKSKNLTLSGVSNSGGQPR